MQGYDVIDFPRAGSVFSTVLPVDQLTLEEHYEFYKSYAQFAVDENNQKEVPPLLALSPRLLSCV